MSNNVTRARLTPVERESQAALDSAFILQSPSVHETEDLLLHLATTTENGIKPHADGYAKPLGYTSTVGYSAPIGNTETKSEDEAALEAAAIQQQVIGMPPVRPNSDESPVSTRETEAEPQKKSLLDRVKEKPLVYAVIAVVLAFIGYKLYRSKRG